MGSITGITSCTRSPGPPCRRSPADRWWSTAASWSMASPIACANASGCASRLGASCPSSRCPPPRRRPHRPRTPPGVHPRPGRGIWICRRTPACRGSSTCTRTSLTCRRTPQISASIPGAAPMSIWRSRGPTPPPHCRRASRPCAMWAAMSAVSTENCATRSMPAARRVRACKCPSATSPSQAAAVTCCCLGSRVQRPVRRSHGCGAVSRRGPTSSPPRPALSSTTAPMS